MNPYTPLPVSTLPRILTLLGPRWVSWLGLHRCKRVRQAIGGMWFCILSPWGRTAWTPVPAGLEEKALEFHNTNREHIEFLYLIEDYRPTPLVFGSGSVVVTTLAVDLPVLPRNGGNGGMNSTGITP